MKSTAYALNHENLILNQHMPHAYVGSHYFINSVLRMLEDVAFDDAI